MKAPILIDESGDITIFDSIEDAERYMEPIDVRNGEYIARDAEGVLLDVRIVTERIPVLFGLWTKAVERVRLSDPQLVDGSHGG